MQSSEARSEDRPQDAFYFEGAVSRLGRKYSLIIFTLFTIIMVLCVNNIYIYRYYNETKSRLESSMQELKAITAEKNDITPDVSGMTDKYKSIEEKYNRIEAQNAEMSQKIKQIQEQNEALAKQNKELAEDNIELQNTIKKAASVGIKPQSYQSFSGISSRGDVQRGTYLGKFLGTAYTPSIEECGNSNGITNSGKPIIPGISIAIDNHYWPFGTVFYIKGLGYAVAMDTGSAIKGKYRFDFAVFDKKFARTLGAKEWEVYLLKLGDGTVKELKF